MSPFCSDDGQEISCILSREYHSLNHPIRMPMCFTLGVRRLLIACVFVAALSSYIGVGILWGIFMDRNILRYSNVCFITCHNARTSASYVLVVMSG